MNKKLLALAVAGAFAAPVAAMADSGNVTIYGQANASFDRVDGGKYEGQTGADKKDGQTTNRITSNSSRLGFKGNEDLGNGLSAVWQVESQLDLDNGVGSLATRNSFVGLSGKSWGTALLGRHDTPYKIATRSLDLFMDGIADNRSLMGGGGASFDGRQNNVLAYVSPDFSGFNGAVAYVAGAEGATTSGQKKGDAWSLMGKYDNGPLMVSLAWERHKMGTAGTGTVAGSGASLGIVGGTPAVIPAANSAEDAQEHAWKLGASYNFGAFQIGGAYEKTSDDLNKNRNNALGATCGSKNDGSAYNGDDCLGHKAWYLSGKYTFGSNAVKLAYANRGDSARDSSTGAKQWTVGFDHNLSKRTSVYALYTKLDNDKYAKFAIGGATSDGAVSAASNGSGTGDATQTAWSFGVKHSF